MLARAIALRSAPLAASRCVRGLPPQTLPPQTLLPQTLLPRTRLPLSPLAPAAPSLRSAIKPRGAFRDFVLGPDVSVGLDGAALAWTACSLALPSFRKPAACRSPPAQACTWPPRDCAHPANCSATRQLARNPLPRF